MAPHRSSFRGVVTEDDVLRSVVNSGGARVTTFDAVEARAKASFGGLPLRAGDPARHRHLLRRHHGHPVENLAGGEEIRAGTLPRHPHGRRGGGGGGSVR